MNLDIYVARIVFLWGVELEAVHADLYEGWD